MTRRRLLRVSVKIGLSGLLIAFAGVFVFGFFGPGAPSTGELIDVGGLPAESARLEAWDGEPVWVIHRSESQLQFLAGLSAYVATPTEDLPPDMAAAHRSLKGAYGVYLAATNRPGVLVRYVRGRPDGLDAGIPWHGGFIDPGSEAVFDAAGRRYRTTPGGPLAVPPHHYTGNATIRLGEW